MPRNYTVQSIRNFENTLHVNPIKIKKNEEAIGKNCEQINNLNKQLGELDRDIKATQTKITGLSSRIEILEKEKLIAEHAASIASHTSKISELPPAIDELALKIKPLEIEIARLSQLLAIKDAQDSLKKNSEQYNRNQPELERTQQIFTTVSKEIHGAYYELNQVRIDISFLKHILYEQDEERRRRVYIENSRWVAEKDQWEQEERERLRKEENNWEHLERERLFTLKAAWERDENLRLAEETRLCEQGEREREHREEQQESSAYSHEMNAIRAAHDRELSELNARHERETKGIEARHAQELRLQEGQSHHGHHGHHDFGKHIHKDMHFSDEVEQRRAKEHEALVGRHAVESQSHQERLKIERSAMLGHHSATITACEGKYRSAKDRRIQSNNHIREQRIQRVQYEHAKREQVESSQREAESNQLRSIARYARDAEYQRRKYSDDERRARELHEINTREEERLSLELPLRQQREASLAKLESKDVQLVRQSDILESQKASLKAKISELEGNIGTELSNIEKAKATLNEYAHEVENANHVERHSLSTQLSHNKTPRDALVKQRNGLIQSIKDHEAHVRKSNDDIFNYKERIKALIPLVFDFSSQNDVVVLEKLLHESQSRRKKLETEVTALKESVSQLEGEINHSHALIRMFKDELDTINKNQFFNHLKTNSLAFYNNFLKKVNKMFSDYYNDFPFENNKAVLCCFADLQTSLKALQDEKLFNPDEQQPGNDSVFDNENVLKYYRLCGFLRRLQQRVAYPITGTEFSLRIEAIFDDTFDREECLQAYAKTPLPETNEEQLSEYDQREYLEFRDQLQQIVDTQSEGIRGETISNARAVLDTIEVARNTPVKENEAPFDYHLNARILRRTAELINDPHNEKLKNEYHRLGERQQVGQPSFGRMIWGAMLTFLSSILLISCVATEVMSFGIASPLTAIGIGVGIVGVLGGVGLFRSSRASGPVQSMQNFIEKTTAVAARSVTTNETKPLLLSTDRQVVPSAPPLDSRDEANGMLRAIK